MRAEIRETDDNFVKFMDCFMRGASLQDIYSESEHGYAVKRPAAQADPEVLRRRTASGRTQFMRIFEHLKNIAAPVDEHIGLAHKRVLDFGCGTGALSIALALKGASVMGVDPTPVSLEACQWRARYFACEERFESRLIDIGPGLPFDDRSFDIVILNSVMEFIPRDRHKYVLDFLRLIKPGGHLVISTENGLFPRDYYTGKILPRFRRKTMIRQNLPYGVTYFELLRWIGLSPRKVESLSARSPFNSIDKLATSRRNAGRAAEAAALRGVNRVIKACCRWVGVPSDVLLPYGIYLFRVTE